MEVSINSRAKTGRQGEVSAARYLEQKGYTILARNQRTPFGEIDLIAEQCSSDSSLTNDRVLVFVEVKTRLSSSLGPPEISITPRKQAHILAAAQAYLQVHPELNCDWRIDVICIEPTPEKEGFAVTHFENAFT